MYTHCNNYYRVFVFDVNMTTLYDYWDLPMENPEGMIYGHDEGMTMLLTQYSL